MTALNIAFIMLGFLANGVIFYSMGVDAGYREGRRTMRKFYDEANKVRA